jgi:DNA-binding SARP family transcriptional activator
LNQKTVISTSNQTVNDDNGYPQAIEFLNLIRTEYEEASERLEAAARTLRQKEAELDRQLKLAVLLSSRYQPLCLATGGEGGTFCVMGSTMLGDTVKLSLKPVQVRLRVKMLGQFEVFTEKKTIERWQSAKAKAIFQYLMTRPRLPVPKETLMEILWPDADPESAGNNLKTAIHNLRQLVNSLSDNKDNYPFILFLQGGYTVNREITLWIDVEEFEKHWEDGYRLEKQGRVGEAQREFENAVGLYRGDYLEDLPYEEWTLQRRESLKDTYISVLSRLADYALAAADYENGIILCQKILAKDVGREDAYRKLICCHSRLGRRQRARDWYEICRRTIWADFETLPEKETTDLYQRLIRNELI